MSDALHLLVDKSTRDVRRNQARIARLLGLLDLDPRVAPEAIHRAVDEELADQVARGLAALDALDRTDPAVLAAADRCATALRETKLQRAPLEAAAEGAPAPVRAVVDTV